jgi:hypothetical protein
VVVDVARAPESTTEVDHEQQPEPRPRFDPQAALQELERFGQDIQRYRAQREALGDEFETFVRSFKTPAAAPPSPPVARGPEGLGPAAPGESFIPRSESPVATATAAPASAAPVSAAPVSAAPASAVPVPVVPVPAAPPSAAPAPAAAALDAPPVPPARASTPVAAIAAGTALLVGGVLLAVLLWNRGPAPDADPAPADVPSAAAPAATPEPAPAPPAPEAPAATTTAAPVRSAESAIVTERQVWMRVTVDGERVLEREVPAGTRIPLRAEKTIVIRTGDAGAVRLSIRGGTGTLLGREGEVVTRSFTVPPRSEAGR